MDNDDGLVRRGSHKYPSGYWRSTALQRQTKAQQRVCTFNDGN